MVKTKVDEKLYEVVETLPYHGLGYPAKVIMVDGREKIAVKKPGSKKWQFWVVEDRLGGG